MVYKTLPVAVTQLTVIITFDQISFQYITNKAKDKTSALEIMIIKRSSEEVSNIPLKKMMAVHDIHHKK